MDRSPWLRRLAKPAIAVGSMSLTAYVGRFAVQSMLPLLGNEAPPWVELLMFILGSMLFAGIWSRFFRRLAEASDQPDQCAR